jgi:hypothetical protein
LAKLEQSKLECIPAVFDRATSSRRKRWTLTSGLPPVAVPCTG